RVMSAGAPVPARTLARFAKMLEPGVPIHTPYGATEALPVALTDSREILGETAAKTARGEGVCVGRPVPGMEVEVIRIEESAIAAWSEELRVPRGQVGEIAVKGRMVTREYFRRPEDMARAKIGAGGEFWHRMGDLGYFDESGRLWFCGRKAHRVKKPDGWHYTICAEGVFNVHPAIKRTALVGVGTTPVLCVETESGVTDEDALIRELLALGERQPFTRDIRRILFHPAFPVDVRHNAKIARERLAVWAAERLR
ncbi:MAG: AMP-binding protein, partial [Elusimicrobia bacterium]|nr:AMP-binding protein [Elusimicrobiota bacterium]